MASGFEDTLRKLMIKDSPRPGSPESSFTGDLPRLTASNGPEENIINVSTSSEDSLEHNVPTLSPGQLGLRVIQVIIDFLVKQVSTFSLPSDVRKLQKYVHQESESHTDSHEPNNTECTRQVTDRSSQHPNSVQHRTVQYGSSTDQPLFRPRSDAHRLEVTLHMPENKPEKVSLHPKNPHQNTRGWYKRRQYPAPLQFNNHARPRRLEVNNTPRFSRQSQVRIDICTYNGQAPGPLKAKQ